MRCSFHDVYLLYSAHLEKAIAVTYSDVCRHNQNTKLKSTRQCRRETGLPFKNELCSGLPDGQAKREMRRDLSFCCV